MIHAVVAWDGIVSTLLGSLRSDLHSTKVVAGYKYLTMWQTAVPFHVTSSTSCDDSQRSCVKYSDRSKSRQRSFTRTITRPVGD